MSKIIPTTEIMEEDPVVLDPKVRTFWKEKAEQIKKETNNYDLNSMCARCIKDQYALGHKDENGKPRLTISCTGLEDLKTKEGEEFFNYLKANLEEEEFNLLEQKNSSMVWMSENIPNKNIFSPRPYQRMIAGCSAKRKVLRMGRRCVEANERIETEHKAIKAKHLWHLYSNKKKMPKIVSYDETTGDLILTDQYVIVPNGISTVYKVTTERNKSTTITSEHPLLVYSNKQYSYIELKDLKPNTDYIVNLDNELEKVQSIVKVGDKQTYHLSVIDYQTFATKGGLIHHNTGKALDIRTEIPTPTGWTTMGELKKGDKVFDDNGLVCNVTYTTEYQYNRTCYEVKFDNGETIIADADHQWSVTSEEDRKDLFNNDITALEQVLTTEQILKSDKLYSVRVSKPITYSHKRFNITPFIYGTELSTSFDKKYLQGSIEQRTALLRGIEQTNKYQPGCIKVNKTVKNEVKELLCSLGYKVFTIESNNDLIYFQYSKDKFLHIVNIKEVESRPVKCITVDSENSLYLASRNYIVTHNTFVMTVGLLHRLLTKKGSKGPFRVLMVAPMDTMIAEVVDQIKKFCDELPVNPIVGHRKTPVYEINFNTGASFKGVTAGASGAKAARGKGADLLYIDECLPATAMIKTLERGLQSIVDVKVGEKILSYDIDKQKTVYKKITAKSEPKKEKVYTYTTLSGRKLRATSNHPVLTSDGWKEIGHAENIATIKTRSKAVVFYESVISSKYTSTEEVYNLAVEGTQNYIADDFIVHNCDFLKPQDLTSVLGVLMESKDTEFWASSTPIGETNLYKLHKDPAFKEFHFPSFVSPEYTQETDDTIRGHSTDSGYIQEACLEENTLVLTDKGNVKIKDLTLEHNVFDKYMNLKPIWQLPRKTGYKETVKYTLSNGEFVICTPDHKFPNINDKKEEIQNLQGLYVKYNRQSYLTNNKEEVLARLIGYNLGDGTIVSTRDEAAFYSRNKGDLDPMIEDLKYLDPSYKGTVREDTTGGNLEAKAISTKLCPRFTVSCSKKLTNLLIEYGAVRGRKVEQWFDVPDFVQQGTKQVKANFIGGLFGAEGCLSVESKGDIKRPSLIMTKKNRDKGFDFFDSLVKLLDDLGINSSYTVEEKTRVYGVNKEFSHTTNVFNLSISSQNTNLIKFLSNIPIRYCIKKEKRVKDLLNYLDKYQSMLQKAITEHTLINRLYLKLRSRKAVRQQLKLTKSVIDHALVRLEPKRVPARYNFLKASDYLKICTEDYEYLYITNTEKLDIKPVYNLGVSTEDTSYILANGVRTYNCADFGADDSGVYPAEFLNKYVDCVSDTEVINDTSESKYRTLAGMYRQDRDRFITIMGVDWNHDSVGTRIFVIAYDKQTNRYGILDKAKVAVNGWTQTKAVEAIVDVNRRYDVDHIYVDEGFGTTQASLLRQFGISQYGKVPLNHPDLKLTKVVAVNFRTTLIIHDPISGEDLRKQTKQFIVETSVNLLRSGSLRLHETFDSDIIMQMKNYVIKSKKANGLKTYTYRDKKIGDHDLDAYNIALYGFAQEYPDFITMSPVSKAYGTPTEQPVTTSSSGSIVISTKSSLINSKFRSSSRGRQFKRRRSW